MEQNLYILTEAQRLLRLAEHNINDEGYSEIRTLSLLRKELNEFIREYQYSEEFKKSEESL